MIFLASTALYSFANTLNQLDGIEFERDQWQRPSEVLQALDLREGNTVVDLGSGVGYFSLKLLHVVGKPGQVIAVDLRKLSLFFLWTRALLRGQSNVHIVVGEPDNPRLPGGMVDAVLICNTYHEFSNPNLMLTHVFRSLRPGGHLVVVVLPPWNTVRALSGKTRFPGTTFTPPLVLVRRTSKATSKHRCIATIVTGKDSIAVENHFLVAVPKDNLLRTCRKLLELLKRPSTSKWMNRCIRCRHLTVGALGSIPWEES